MNSDEVSFAWVNPIREHRKSHHVTYAFAVVVLLAFASIAEAQQARPPRFEDYPVTEIFEGKVHPPQFETPEQERYRREISIAGTRLPNFAGRYIVIEMFCGRECENVAIVDAKAGRIYPSPFKSEESSYALPPPAWDFQQPRYTSFSKLFIVPNVCPEGRSACGTYYFVWENDTFRVVHKVPVSAEPIIPTTSPLIGSWEGQWSYSTGFETPTQRFRMTFVERRGRLTGEYVNLDDRAKRRVRIANVTATKADKSTYRMEIDGNCWNLSVDNESMSGMWNCGPCTVLGVGPGARLIGFEAKRAGAVVAN